MCCLFTFKQRQCTSDSLDTLNVELVIPRWKQSQSKKDKVLVQLKVWSCLRHWFLVMWLWWECLFFFFLHRWFVLQNKLLRNPPMQKWRQHRQHAWQSACLFSVDGGRTAGGKSGISIVNHKEHTIFFFQQIVRERISTLFWLRCTPSRRSAYVSALSPPWAKIVISPSTSSFTTFSKFYLIIFIRLAESVVKMALFSNSLSHLLLSGADTRAAH